LYVKTIEKIKLEAEEVILASRIEPNEWGGRDIKKAPVTN
jgi:hypothetical protein